MQLSANEQSSRSHLTRNTVICLLLISLAFVLFNLYISLRQSLSVALKQSWQLISELNTELSNAAYIMYTGINFFGDTQAAGIE